MTNGSEEAVEEQQVTGEQLLEMIKRAEAVAADRLVILRRLEMFFQTVDSARTSLLADIQEINAAIVNRESGVIPQGEGSDSSEEE